MAFIEDGFRVAETATGTSSVLTLTGALSTYQRFSAVCATSDTVPYCIVADNGNIEEGIGTYSAANQLTRAGTPIASSNSGSSITLGSGTHTVFLGYPGLKNVLANIGTISLGGAVGAESLKVLNIASAVNRHELSGSVTGSGVVAAAAGTDSNIPWLIAPKGAAAEGYAPGLGVGGTVTQATSKATGVTLNKACGQITMNNASLGAGIQVSFTLTNSAIGTGDQTFVQVVGGVADTTTYQSWASGSASGSTTITLRNLGGGSLSEAVVLSFSVFKVPTT